MTTDSELLRIHGQAYAEFFATDLDVGEPHPNDAADLYALRAVAEAAWDECVKSIVYDSGQPVEIIAVVNPFRSVPKEQQ